MTISIIASVGKNRAIGFKNQIPWHLRIDLKRFKSLTLGHTIIMGENTFRSPRQVPFPLPGRQTIVLSVNPGFQAPGCLVAHSLEEAIRMCSGQDEVFIVGGGQTYKNAFPLANKMYLTWVDASPEADTYFPEFNPTEWQVISSEDFPADEQNDYKSTYTVYERS